MHGIDELGEFVMVKYFLIAAVAAAVVVIARQWFKHWADSRRQSQQRLLDAMNHAYDKGRADQAQVTPVNQPYALADIENVDVTEEASGLGGSLGEELAFWLGTAGLCVVGICVACLFYGLHADELVERLQTAEALIKPAPFDTKFEGWKLEEYVELRKTGVEVLKMPPAPYRLLVNDPKTSTWKVLSVKGEYSLDELGWKESPAELRGYFAVHGINRPDDGDSKKQVVALK
jgi:hypothetical protein